MAQDVGTVTEAAPAHPLALEIAVRRLAKHRRRFMPDTLWNFSLRYYRDASAQQACLAFQDEHGGDVNVALYLLWRAARGDVIDRDAMRVVDDHVRRWREEVVAPLRAVRRAMKNWPLGPPAEAQERIRTRVKALELEAEKEEQALLGELDVAAARHVPPAEAAVANLNAYAAFLKTTLPETLVSAFVSRLEEVGRN